MSEATPTMRIRDWHDRFENHRTRELKTINWRPEPLNTDLYCEIVAHEDGAAHYGALTAIRNVAAQGNPRGSLTRENGRPHDAQSLARLARLPETLVDAVIKRLIDIGEIEIRSNKSRRRNQIESRSSAEMSHPSAEIPRNPAPTGRERREGKEGKEGQTDARASARSLSPISPQEARLTDEQISASWSAAGFDGPEDYERWFGAVYKAHPTRGGYQLAKDSARNAILAGELQREAFESGYAAWKTSREWQRADGQYIPGLAKLISDRFWQFPPLAPTAAEENWA